MLLDANPPLSTVSRWLASAVVHRFPGVSPYNIENDPSSGLLPFIDAKPLGKIGDGSEGGAGLQLQVFLG